MNDESKICAQKRRNKMREETSKSRCAAQSEQVELEQRASVHARWGMFESVDQQLGSGVLRERALHDAQSAPCAIDRQCSLPVSRATRSPS